MNVQGRRGHIPDNRSGVATIRKTAGPMRGSSAEVEDDNEHNSGIDTKMTADKIPFNPDMGFLDDVTQ